MTRRVLVFLVSVLVLVAMMAFASLAFAQESPSCTKGIKTARVASANRQGPPHNPKIPDFANEKAHPAPPFGGCPPTKH